MTEFCNQSQIKPAFGALLLISLRYKKKGVRGLSCVYIELRMHARISENIQEARITQQLLRLCSANFLRASIIRYTDTINNFITQGREVLSVSSCSPLFKKMNVVLFKTILLGHLVNRLANNEKNRMVVSKCDISL